MFALLMARARPLLIAVVVLAVSLVAGALTARAQVPPIGGPPSSTTTTPPPTAVPAPSTTVLRPTPTTTRPRSTTTTAPAPAQEATTTTLAPPPRVVPPEALAQMQAVVRTPPNSTAGLLQALQPFLDFGLSPQEVALQYFGHFPVAGLATWSDDWLYPRFVPTFHMHQGNDIFGDRGTPVRAPFAGALRHADEPVGGLAAYVYLPDGTYVYMAHLDAFVDGQSDGAAVQAGQVVGFLGDSGDAKGGSPHVHFEIHPNGGAAVDPKPFLDQWTAEATAAVPAELSAYQASRPRALVATGETRRLGGGSPSLPAPAEPPRSQLLWASSASPAGGPVHLAQAEAALAARQVDWAELARREDARRAEFELSDQWARTVLAPLTPGALRSFLRLSASS